MGPTPHEVSQLLEEHRNGDPQALEKLMPLVYDELRRLAAYQLQSERPDHTLQPTALVHEAFLRLVDQSDVQLRNRAHFFALAAQIMRHVLVDHARARQSGKRGGGQVAVPLEEGLEVAEESNVDLVALDDALAALAVKDERKCRVVELRYFGGLSIEETAEVLGISPTTVRREWVLARAWLRREIERPRR